MVSPIHERALDLPGEGKTWDEKCIDYLRDVFELLDEKPHTDEGLAEYIEELSATLRSLACFDYLARGERDRALAEGYRRFPKGAHNSAESDALARNYASPADRLHKLLQEVTEAVRDRKSAGQTRTNYLRAQLEHLT